MGSRGIRKPRHVFVQGIPGTALERRIVDPDTIFGIEAAFALFADRAKGTGIAAFSAMQWIV